MVALPLLTCFWRAISRSRTRLTIRTQTSVTMTVTAMNSAVSAMPGSSFCMKFSSQAAISILLSQGRRVLVGDAPDNHLVRRLAAHRAHIRNMLLLKRHTAAGHAGLFLDLLLA